MRALDSTGQDNSNCYIIVAAFMLYYLLKATGARVAYRHTLHGAWVELFYYVQVLME